MKKCVFLTMHNLDGFVSDDQCVFQPLANLGWTVELVPWRQMDIDWNDFNAVIIRTTWDYQNDPQAFLSVLENIDRSTAHLENSLSLVRWNMRKTYLRDLEKQGVGIVPTVWGSGISSRRIHALFEELDADEIIIKPTIGANADDTFRLTRDTDDATRARIEAVFNKREYMAQPFMRGIIEEGEFSLFFFGGEYSHTILKTPKAQDFRVQEEHGGHIQSADAEALLLTRAEDTMETIEPAPLYARVDFVRANGDFLVMELELIEPSLYFRMDLKAPERFAKALDKWIQL